MDEDDFEGTLVLERLAEAGRLEAFWDAVDAEDVGAAEALLLAANVDDEIITQVLEKMSDEDADD